MARYYYRNIDGFDYSVPHETKPRKKKPPLAVVMNQNCTSCSGSPVCASECPVDCIHLVYNDGRPARVYVDYDICIGCLNCFSYDYRPKHFIKGDKQANLERINHMDERTKSAVCPWNAIEVCDFDEGEDYSQQFYTQPTRLVEADAE